jgi:hypothetical protein
LAERFLFIWSFKGGYSGTYALSRFYNTGERDFTGVLKESSGYFFKGDAIFMEISLFSTFSGEILKAF